MRKLVAQVGVIIFIIQILALIFEPFLFFLGGELSALTFLFFQSGIFLLLIAAVLPTHVQDDWGSMWPLVGYDNAIDAIYTRGPWWVRFEELEEQERQKGVIDGMNKLLDTA